MAPPPLQERQPRRRLQRQAACVSGGGGIKDRIVSASVRARFPNSLHRTSGTCFLFLVATDGEGVVAISENSGIGKHRI